MIIDEKKLLSLFNIVEWSYDIKPKKVEFDIGSSNKKWVLNSILDKYRNHSSIIVIHKKRNLQSNSISIFTSNWGSKITAEEIKTIPKFLNSKKASGIDKIPMKLIKLAYNVLVKPRSIAINNS